MSYLAGLLRWVRATYPDLAIAGSRDGYFDEGDLPDLIDGINRARPDVLLVALGVPKQELWIDAHLDRIDVQLAIGVGGLFDFYSGRLHRAPLWMRKLGIEWLYRLSLEPGRLWKRYILGNPVFLWHVLKSRIRFGRHGG